jgi:hypothetical protein
MGWIAGIIRIIYEYHPSAIELMKDIFGGSSK